MVWVIWPRVTVDRQGAPPPNRYPLLGWTGGCLGEREREKGQEGGVALCSRLGAREKKVPSTGGLEEYWGACVGAGGWFQPPPRSRVGDRGRAPRILVLGAGGSQGLPRHRLGLGGRRLGPCACGQGHRWCVRVPVARGSARVRTRKRGGRPRPRLSRTSRRRRRWQRPPSPCTRGPRSGRQGRIPGGCQIHGGCWSCFGIPG